MCARQPRLPLLIVRRCRSPSPFMLITFACRTSETGHASYACRVCVQLRTLAHTHTRTHIASIVVYHGTINALCIVVAVRCRSLRAIRKRHTDYKLTFTPAIYPSLFRQSLVDGCLRRRKNIDFNRERAHTPKNGQNCRVRSNSSRIQFK